MTNRRSLSAGFCNASMVLYILWLLLPCMQALGHAAFGVATVALFGVGVALDGDTLPRHWRSFLPRVFCAVALPFLLWRFLDRGASFWGFYAQQGMFWFPLLWTAYARQQDDARLYRFVKQTLLAAMLVTTLTTIGWLVQGILRGNGEKVYAYSRSLGYGEPGNEAYLRELMLRNIGGYDFIYASVLALPITCYAISVSHGWKRVGFSLFCAAQSVMIVLSQYTYATLFAAFILLAEILAALIRWLARVTTRRSLSLGASLCWTLPVFLAVWLAREPLVGWAASLATSLGFQNAAFSLSQLLQALNGAAVDSASRLEYYRIPLEGFATSPLVGSVFSGMKRLSQHSDVLDLLSGVGVLGSFIVGAAIWVIGRGERRVSRAKAALVLQWAMLGACALVGTVVYSRDIMVVVCLSAYLTNLPSKPALTPAD